MYKALTWKDHFTEPRNAYNMKQNSDGSVTLSSAGEVIQQGTPMNAKNFNNMEHGILDADLANRLLSIKTKNNKAITPTAESVGAVQRKIWKWVVSEGENLFDYINAKLREGYTQGVIQVEATLATPTDIPAEVVSASGVGVYFICIFQRHYYDYVRATLYGDSTLTEYTNRAKLADGTFKYAWVQKMCPDGYFPLTGGKLNGGIIADTFMVAPEHYGTPVEVGRYIDFHLPDSTADQDGRLNITETKELRYNDDYVWFGRFANSGSCNDLKNGAWTVPANVTEKPNDEACIIHHKRWDNNFQSQIAMTSTGGTFSRVMSGGVWGSWHRLFDSSANSLEALAKVLPEPKWELIGTKTYNTTGNNQATNISEFSLSGLKKFYFEIDFTSSGSGTCNVNLYAGSTKVLTVNNGAATGRVFGEKCNIGWFIHKTASAGTGLSDDLAKNTSIDKLEFSETSYPSGTYTLNLYGVKE